MKKTTGITLWLMILIAILTVTLASCDKHSNTNPADTTDAPHCDHIYGEWVAVEEANCLMTGKQIRTCSLCGNQDATYALGDHGYGEWIEEAPPTFFEEGALAHYECRFCHRHFDADNNPLASSAIPKLIPELSVCLDGVEAARFTVDSSTTQAISLSLKDLSVTKGQTVTVCRTGNLSEVYAFTVEEDTLSSLGAVWGNIDPVSKQIRSTAVSSLTLTLSKDQDAMILRMDGYVTEGVVVEITSSRSGGKPMLFPMSEVDHMGDKACTARVFGIMGSDGSTSLRILDTDSGQVYGYDDISPSLSWDTWSFSRGKNGEIRFSDTVTDWWIAFDIDGDGKITLRRFNLPAGVKPTLAFDSGEEQTMNKIGLAVGSDEYDRYVWPLTNGVFTRTETWQGAVGAEDLTVYRTVLEVEDTALFYIPFGTNDKLSYHHLSEVEADEGAVVSYYGRGSGKNFRDYIKIAKAGTYTVEYLPFCNVINIYEYTEPDTPDVPDVPDTPFVPVMPEAPDVVEGMAIEINGIRYPMNRVTYPDGGDTSYVFGYFPLQAGDTLQVLDTDSGAVYGFDALSEDMAWNTWDFGRGENGEILIRSSARYGIEFDYNGGQKISLNKVFAPADGDSFSVVLADSTKEGVAMDPFVIANGSSTADEFMWTLTHATTMNQADIVAYIEKNGLCFYTAMVELEAGTKFRIQNLTSGDTVGADYLIGVTGDLTALTKNGDWVEVLVSGSYFIMHLPAFNSFSVDVYSSTVSNEVYLYLDGETACLTPDENGDVYRNGFTATESSCIMIADSNYNFLSFTLDLDMDASLAELSTVGEYSMLYPTRSGSFNLRYNVNTHTVFLEPVEGDGGGGDDASSMDDYYIFLSVIDETNGDQTIRLTAEPGSLHEVCAKGVTIAANSFIAVGTLRNDGIGSSNSYGELSDTDPAIAGSYGTIAMITVDGTFDVYFVWETKTIRVVRVA